MWGEEREILIFDIQHQQGLSFFFIISLNLFLSLFLPLPPFFPSVCPCSKTRREEKGRERTTKSKIFPASICGGYFVVVVRFGWFFFFYLSNKSERLRATLKTV